MRKFPHGETVTLHRRRARRDPFGQLITDAYGMVQYEDELETITGAVVWPYNANETVQGQERSSTGYVLALPEGAVADADDAISWRGKTYEVIGETEMMYQNPMTGTPGPNVLLMRRVEG